MKFFPFLILILDSVSSSADDFQKQEAVEKNPKDVIEVLHVMKRVFDIIPNTKLCPQADSRTNEPKIRKYAAKKGIRKDILREYAKQLLKTFFREMKK